MYHGERQRQEKIGGERGEKRENKCGLKKQRTKFSNTNYSNNNNKKKL